MTIATSLKNYLQREGVDYELIHHSHTEHSTETAAKAHVPGGSLAKCVVLEDEKGYLMAVIPTDRRVDLGAVHRRVDRLLGLATEQELSDLFEDCEPGAVPPLGDAYGYDVLIDDNLIDCQDIYFEAGDHTDLVHVRGEDFRVLMSNADHGSISRPI